MKMFCLLILCFGLIPLESPRADYVLSLKHEGSATVSTTPGGRFSVAAVLSTNAADQHDSVIFRIVFSAPGPPILTFR